jgi:hypothetical protein
VIASGALDDGTAGLHAVKEAGGTAVVQDPADAGCGSMPTRAMERVSVDHCVKAVDLADLLVRLVALPAPPVPTRAAVPLETPEEAPPRIEATVVTGAIIDVESGLTCRPGSAGRTRPDFARAGAGADRTQ